MEIAFNKEGKFATYCLWQELGTSVSVMVTGPDMAVCKFKSVIAAASEAYVAASPGVVLPGLVTVTCAFAIAAKQIASISK